MTPKIVLTKIFVLLSVLATAQINDDGSSSIYQKDFQYGFSAHTSGFGLNTKYTVNKTYDIKRQFDFDWVASMKHKKETVTRNNGSRGFVFGKKFEMSVLRATYGRQKIIADYDNALSVRVNWHYGLGINAALLKPIYYQESVSGEKENTLFDPDRHFFPQQFLGKAKWTEGLNELQFRPGITGKMALSFEWGRQDDQFKSLETGVMVDLYAQRIPIMAFTDNNYAFINLYAAMMIGNRW